MIRLQPQWAWMSTWLATKSAPIKPMGLSSERKGPSTSRRTRIGRPPEAQSRERRLMSWPSNRLLISYSGLTAGWISASEVLNHSSGAPCPGRPSACWANNSASLQLLRAFTSRAMAVASWLRFWWELMPWLSTNTSTPASSAARAASWPVCQRTWRRGMVPPSGSRRING